MRWNNTDGSDTNGQIGADKVGDNVVSMWTRSVEKGHWKSEKIKTVVQDETDL